MVLPFRCNFDDNMSDLKGKRSVLADDISLARTAFLKLMEKTVDRYDLISGYCLFHFSFVLRTIVHNLPETLDPAERASQIRSIVLSAANVADGGSIIVAGSAAEGLFIPSFTTKDKDKGDQLVSADIDIMRVIRAVAVHNLSPGECEHTCLIADTSGCHPGYTKLKITSLRPTDISLPTSIINGDVYMTTHVFQPPSIANVFPELFSINDQDAGGDLGFEKRHTNVRHGPALTGLGVYSFWTDRFKINFECDIVPAISCEWPSIADQWESRVCLAQWPPKDLVDSIVHGVCHVVPVAHTKSQNSYIEWRFSFSAAELKLAHSLTFFQRRCYTIFKMLCYEGLLPKKIIPTYFLKTTLFWVCESQPGQFWDEDNIASIIVCLIDRLIGFLVRGTLPNYFIPKNNMISHIPRSTVQDILKCLQWMRRDPVTVLIKFNENNSFSKSGISWKTCFCLIFKDMRSRLNGKWSRFSLLETGASCVQSVRFAAHFQITNKNYKEAFENLVQLVAIKCIISRPTPDSEDPLSQVSTLPLCQPDVLQTFTLFMHINALIHFQDFLLDKADTSESLTTIYSNIGRLFLIRSQLGADPLPSLECAIGYYKRVEPAIYEEQFTVDCQKDLSKAEQNLRKGLTQKPTLGKANALCCDLARVSFYLGHFEEVRKICHGVITEELPAMASVFSLRLIEQHMMEPSGILGHFQSPLLGDPSQSGTKDAILKTLSDMSKQFGTEQSLQKCLRSKGNVNIPCAIFAEYLYVLSLLAAESDATILSHVTRLKHMCSAVGAQRYRDGCHAILCDMIECVRMRFRIRDRDSL